MRWKSNKISSTKGSLQPSCTGWLGLRGSMFGVVEIAVASCTSQRSAIAHDARIRTADNEHQQVFVVWGHIELERHDRALLSALNATRIRELLTALIQTQRQTPDRRRYGYRRGALQGRSTRLSPQKCVRTTASKTLW